jgi:outer membrane protein OmpA-like peptidoglycan-associated protein
MQVGVGSTQVVVTSASLRGLSSIILSGQLATGQRFEISLPLKQQWAITETVYFLGDSYRLTSAAKKALLSFARLVKGKVGAVRIDVTGFVRRTSNTSYDQRLSRLRAEGIVRELRRLGVVARYSVTAAGIAKENSPVARRAEIYGYSW